MLSNSNAQVLSHFSSATSEVIEVDATQLVTVLYVPYSRDLSVSEHCSSVLSKRELERAERFSTEFENRHYKQRRAFRRYCAITAIDTSQTLQSMVFEQTENGRPFVHDSPDVWFSFSSCRSGFIGAWSSTHAIGVDLEQPADKVEAIDLARQFFSVQEAKIVEAANNHDRLGLFYTLWTLKEAALKSIGQGLPFGLEVFKFALDPHLQIIDAPAEFGGTENFDALMIKRQPLCAAIVFRKLC